MSRGEAPVEICRDEAEGTRHENEDIGSAKLKAGAGTLLEAALTRENLRRAFKRVRANKGSAGVDGLDIAVVK